jgi:hypothetical protein
MELQVILNTFASDVFRKQADYDYIAARANYRMRLRQQFLWSAHQSVEKYLKAKREVLHACWHNKEARVWAQS